LLANKRSVPNANEFWRQCMKEPSMEQSKTSASHERKEGEKPK
jgi:hypothetical protein